MTNANPTKAAALFALMLPCYVLDPHTVHAQLRTATSSLLLPPMPIVEPEGAWGVDLNPSALGFLDDWRVSGLVSRSANGPTEIHRSGESISAALPLWGGIAAGLSAASIRPDSTAGIPSRGLASLAVSYAFDKRFSLGTALRFVPARDPSVDGIVTWDLGLTHRPSPYFSWTLSARDLSRPRPVARDPSVPRSATLAIALRPFQHDRLTFEAAGALGEAGHKGLRIGLFSRMPGWGKLGITAETQGIYGGDAPYGLFEHVLVTAGLSVDMGRAQVAGGTYLTHHNNLSASPGWYVAASLSGQSHLPAWAPGFALKYMIESDAGPSWIKTLHTLQSASRLKALGAIVLQMKSNISLAHAQELMAAITTLRNRGKFVWCHFESASQNGFYACSAAQRSTIDAAGSLALMGFAHTTLLFGKTLQDVGVHADFVRIGKYKSAPEQFTQNRSSDPAREQREIFANDVYEQFVTDLARMHKKERATVETWINQGPYTRGLAVRQGLFDGVADGANMDAELIKNTGKDLPLLDSLPVRPSRYWSYPPRVGVLLVDGMIVDGESVDIPGLGIHLAGAETLVKAIEKLTDDPSIGAIVVRIDSGGGSALASDQVWRALMRARAKKPVIASMGSIAASGGYYIASAAQYIFALPSTLTGSIGIFFGKADLAPLASKLGIGVEFTQRGAHAGADSIWRPFSAEERSVLQRAVADGYQQFLQRIATSRHMSIATVDSLGQGRIWSGLRAQQKKLVDAIGDINAAIMYARRLAHLPEDADITIVPKRPDSLVEFLLGPSARTSHEALTLLRPLTIPLGETINWLWVLAQGPLLLALPENILSLP